MNKQISLLSLLLASVIPGHIGAQVTSEQLLKSGSHNWFTTSGDYAAQRHSLLDQINTRNVEHLAVKWVFQLNTGGKFEATPLVIDGAMYVTGPNNTAYALDARSGRPIWSYRRALPPDLRACCGLVNRGFAALGEKLFMGTLDAHVVALDSKTGQVVWDVEAVDYRKGYSFTVAPLVVKDKVILGVAGGEYGIRGFIDAYDVETGRRAWRFYTIPGPGEPGHETWKGESWKIGGAPAWVTGSYDPELNLIYWPTGNPSPSSYGRERAGDNLYSNSVVALDADTGKLNWHFQFTPHDLWDWDATEVPVLLDLEIGSQMRKLLVQANRNGFFYVLDRSNGKFLFAKPFARLNWAKEIGPDGRPVMLPGLTPTPEGTIVCPGAVGATNFMSPAYSPQTGLFYVAVREQCNLFTSSPQEYRQGRVYVGSAYGPTATQKDSGGLRALDPRTGEVKWGFEYMTSPWGGALSTQGGLVFAGDMEGNVIAFDARTGKDLWHLQTGGSIHASPMTYAIDGKQYLVTPAGGALFAFGLPEDKIPR